MLTDQLQVIRTGYLKKPGHVIHNWKIRWYILYENSLSRFERIQGAQQLLGREIGRIQLCDIHHINTNLTHKSKPHCFELVLTSGACKILRASNTEDMNDWVKCIRYVMLKNSALVGGADLSWQPNIGIISILDNTNEEVQILRGKWGKTQSLRMFPKNGTIRINLSEGGKVECQPPSTSTTTKTTVNIPVHSMRIGGKSVIKIEWTESRLFDSSKTSIICLFTLVIPVVFYISQGITSNSPLTTITSWLPVVTILLINILLYTMGVLKKDLSYWNIRCLEWRAELALTTTTTTTNTTNTTTTTTEVLVPISDIVAGLSDVALENYRCKFLMAPDYGRFMKSEPTELECLKRWISTQLWRERNQVDQILQQPHLKYEFIRECYPAFIMGKAKDGSIIYCERPGDIQFDKLADRGCTIQDLLYHYIFITEFLWNHVSSSQTSRTFFILDIAGCGFKEAMGGDVMTFLKEASKFCQDHYPERSQKMFIINAPMWFSIFWKAASTFVSEVTRKKITICSSNYKTKLLKYIDEDQLPHIWGGSGPDLGSSAWEKKMDELASKLNNIHK